MLLLQATAIIQSIWLNAYSIWVVFYLIELILNRHPKRNKSEVDTQNNLNVTYQEC